MGQVVSWSLTEVFPADRVLMLTRLNRLECGPGSSKCAAAGQLSHSVTADRVSWTRQCLSSSKLSVADVRSESELSVLICDVVHCFYKNDQKAFLFFIFNV